VPLSLRMMTYVALLYQDLIKQRKIGPKDRLPPVVPIVLYNGESPWRGERKLQELVGKMPRGLERFVPHFEYLLIDEVIVKDACIEEKNLVNALFALDRMENPMVLQDIVDHLAVWLKLPKYRFLRRAFAVWIGHGVFPARKLTDDNVDFQDLGEVRNMLQQRMKQWVKTLEEKGIEKGEKKGEKKGRKEGLETVARKLLERGFSVKETAELTGLTQKEVRRLMEG